MRPILALVNYVIPALLTDKSPGIHGRETDHWNAASEKRAGRYPMLFVIASKSVIDSTQELV